MAVGTDFPADRFEREYGCTEQEWRRWMPRATHGHACTETGAQALRVAIGGGALGLHWQMLPPRVIALVRLPRLRVQFHFDGVAADERARFLQRFDLHLQRGGG
jgi:hypothetical protein